MADYDIGKAFAKVEHEIMASMIRNMKRHRLEEIDEKKQWSMWQVEQLKALEKFKRENRKKYGQQFKDINSSIDSLIREAKAQGKMDQEIRILEAIKKGFSPRALKKSVQTNGEFFKLNERKLEALIKATTDDMKKAETAVLRMAEDQYRQVIFDAQVYANTGAGTYEKAVDMATKDFISRGINCITYANGARHTMAAYADMAIRTAAKRAYLQGEGEMRKEWGISTVIMNKRNAACPLCLPFAGKVMIDDVWSGGTAKDGPYPLMSSAIAKGLYHPNCRDVHTTYFEGISTPPDSKFTRDEIAELKEGYREEQKQQYAKRQADKFNRLAEFSLDEENKNQYEQKANKWKHVYFKTGNTDNKKYADSKRPLANFRAVPREGVVNILRRESRSWIQNLTDEEKKAIRKYTYNPGDKKPNRFFERMNAMLRGDLPEDPKLREYANTISSALKKNKLKEDVICYRNMDVNPIANRKEGSLVKFKQFTSTSVVPGKALNKKCKIKIYAPKGTAGAYIEELSEFPDQREVLLDKDCVYRVISNKGNEIELEVII